MAGYIAEILFMLFFAYIAVNGQNIAEYDTYWLIGFPIINLRGTHFMSIFSVFPVIAGWIAETLSMLFFSYTAV